MKVELLVALLSVPIGLGVIATRITVKQRQRKAIKSRLAKFVDMSPASQSLKIPQEISLLKVQGRSSLDSLREWLPDIHLIAAMKSLLLEAALEDHEALLVQIAVALLLGPLLVAFAFGLNLTFALLLGLLLPAGPFVYVKTRAEARRSKFSELLPDAIDLMVAVLRSGHSVSESVKAISREIPSPVGDEFETILHRMNLGQPLSDSLMISAKRFKSYELDLMTRAVTIQAEVGGSLADLLEKTNATLRERLKLARQLKVVTAQSRLSAIIVGLLPIILAVALNFMSPGYLNSLVEDQLGRTLLMAAIALEVMGIVLMRRMSELKV